MIIQWRVTLDWFVEAHEKDDNGEPRVRHLTYARHLYFPDYAAAIEQQQWHEANVDKWLPSDACRCDSPAYWPNVSEVQRIERPDPPPGSSTPKASPE